MKEFGMGILELLGAIIVTILITGFGFAYSLGYSIWLTITLKKWYAFFLFWWKLIDGIFAALGYMLHGIAYGLDLIWNVVAGEMIEDTITAKEDTEFAKKNVTVSASTGKLEIERKLNGTGKKFSKVLNFAFGQKAHAKDSWNYLVGLRKLKGNYFK